jgi:hypothetical protein
LAIKKSEEAMPPGLSMPTESSNAKFIEEKKNRLHPKFRKEL